MMLEKMYYDTFTNEYVLDYDKGLAPPERYIATRRGSIDAYIETWEVNQNGINCTINVVYPKSDYYNIPIHNKILKDMIEKYQCQLLQLVWFILPPNVFDEYVERFHLDESYVTEET